MKFTSSKTKKRVDHGLNLPQYTATLLDEVELNAENEDETSARTKIKVVNSLVENMIQNSKLIGEAHLLNYGGIKVRLQE